MIKLAVIRDNLIDLLGIEQTVFQRIDRHSKEERIKKYDQAFVMVEKIKGVLSLHIGELERHLSSIDGGFESKLKKTASSFVDSVANIYEKLRTTEPVSRSLRDDYTLLNHAVISCGMLHTAMLAINENDIADMARIHMTDFAQLVVELSEVIPFVLAAELAEELNLEGGNSVAQQAVAQYREAWTQHRPSAGH
ncbi:MAG: hypothetical protein ACP5IL_04250 [Syntrophobacteraceae bacterium]